MLITGRLIVDIMITLFIQRYFTDMSKNRQLSLPKFSEYCR